MVTSTITTAVSIGFAIGHIPAAGLTCAKALEKTSGQSAEIVFRLLIPFLTSKGIVDFQ